MTNEDPKVVTISREALRADLAEMELRLRIWIGTELAQKADAIELQKLKAEFTERATWADGLMPLRDRMIKEHEEMRELWRSAEQGHFTEAQQNALRDAAQDVLDAKLGEGWSRRERMFALIGIVLAASVTIANFAERVAL